jgi:hypothetical protein
LPVLPAVTAAKDGATLPVQISLSPVPTASESFVLAVIRDATETGRRDDLLDLARGAVADQPHLTRDLLDRVAHHLFQVGLSLQAVADLPGNVARERLTESRCRTGPLRALPKHLLGDDELLDLAGAFVDPEQPDVAVQPFDRNPPDVAAGGLLPHGC